MRHFSFHLISIIIIHTSEVNVALQKNFIDITGQRFGRLIAISVHKDPSGRAMWECRCDCGKTTIVRGSNLRCGATTSCGCYNRERIADESVKSNTTHGARGTRLYRIWAGMKSRCTNKNAKNYHYYGERGITVCDEWISFEPFQAWAMSHGYNESLSIDRIDNDGNYEPSNCRWIPMSEQQRNKRNTRKAGVKSE